MTISPANGKVGSSRRHPRRPDAAGRPRQVRGAPARPGQRLRRRFHDWHPQKAFDMYYDDVVLDMKRPGCLD